MNGQNNVVEGETQQTNSAASEWNQEKVRSYIRYLYRQNQRLWEAIRQLQEENNRLHTGATKVEPIYPGVE